MTVPTWTAISRNPHCPLSAPRDFRRQGQWKTASWEFLPRMGFVNSSLSWPRLQRKENRHGGKCVYNCRGACGRRGGGEEAGGGEGFPGSARGPLGSAPPLNPAPQEEGGYSLFVGKATLLPFSADLVPHTPAASLRDASVTDRHCSQSPRGPCGKVEFPNEPIGWR